MTLTPEQAAHYKILAEAHQDTPGDLAAAYRTIGELLDENERWHKAAVPASMLWHEWLKYANTIGDVDIDHWLVLKSECAVTALALRSLAELLNKDAS